MSYSPKPSTRLSFSARMPSFKRSSKISKRRDVAAEDLNRDVHDDNDRVSPVTTAEVSAAAPRRSLRDAPRSSGARIDTVQGYAVAETTPMAPPQLPSLAELRRGATTRLEALRTDFGRSGGRRLKATIPRPLGRGGRAEPEPRRRLGLLKQ